MNGVAGFGEALRKHRHARGLTQLELAELAGLSERAVSDLERGLKHPQRATVRLLIDALELGPDEAEGLELAARSRTPSANPSADGHATPNLPSILTTFVGREAAVAIVVGCRAAVVAICARLVLERALARPRTFVEHRATRHFAATARCSE